MRRSLRSLLLLACLLLGAVAPRCALGACARDGEPALDVLTAAALSTASLEPARLRALVARSRRAALLPHLRVQVGRGTYDYLRNPDTLQVSTSSTDTWSFQIAVDFALDRLVFDPHELRAAETAGRIAGHRVALLEQVTTLWADRRRLDVGTPSAAASEAGSGASATEDRCAELTAILDALTGGALRRARAPTPRSSAPGVAAGVAPGVAR